MSSKRPRCPRCARPLRTCLCQFAIPIANRVELCIVQHPSETNNAKNTAGLLLLSLQHCQRLIGETFDQALLQHQLHAQGKQPLLLYPPTPEEKTLGLYSPAPLPELGVIAPEKLRLVVLDGTWKKSRKLLYLNPVLQQLPRLCLDQVPASIYKIRKADSENQLSTLEASCYALEQLEPNSSYQPLLEAFRHFIDQFASYIPSHSPDH